MAIGESLDVVRLLDFLDCDPRPTLILDTSESVFRESLFSPVYCNPALVNTDYGRLISRIRGNDVAVKPTQSSFPFTEFQSWAAQPHQSVDDHSFRDQLIYHDFSWTRIPFDDRWILISGCPTSTKSRNSRRDDSASSAESRLTLGSSRSRSLQSTLHAYHGSFDWTDEDPPERTTAHIDFARSVQWDRTPLGPMSTWSTQMRSSANLVMQDPRPAVIFWGPELIMMYNESYVEILGEMHPTSMGKGARSALGPVFEHFEPVIARNMAGEPVEETNTQLFFDRAGFLEETYFSMKFMPIFNSEGSTIGHYESMVENTKQQLLQRRFSTLLELSDEVPRARDIPSFCTLVTEVLSHNKQDVPFTLLYSVESDDVNPISIGPPNDNTHCILRGWIGLDDASATRHSHLAFRENDGFMPYFRQSLQSRDPIIVQFKQGTPEVNLIRGFKTQGFGEPCRAAAVFAISPTPDRTGALGFLVIGLNPRTPYDDDYQRFIRMASKLLSTTLAAILLHEEDINRRERAIARAEAMKSQLKAQLLVTQKEVERNSLKFQRFAERADIGIFIIGRDGVYSYRNAAWFGIFKPKNLDIELGDAWEELIDDDYAAVGKMKFEKLMKEKVHQSFELRLKRKQSVASWNVGNSLQEEEPMWVLCSVFPELSEDGEVLEIVGCVTDISRQKWGEKVQFARAADAQEAKRQLENFIDITSHEMRNPLSAIAQCADGIIASHRSYEDSIDRDSVYQSMIEPSIDAAETILQCSQHMKCIVDDVLTMSKLDSGLLMMTPVDVQPELVARNAIKMFEGEAKSADIALSFELEDSWRQNNGDWVSLDPTRLLQILINLITNALKFTRLERIRAVSISMGMSLKRPHHSAVEQVAYSRMLDGAHSQLLQADWDTGEAVYLHFTVRDTGRGLNEAEKALLFARFSQASPRTHIHYGGSGLGLFICRRLAEMHGGAIGFTSNAGSGSTFSFYIKGRRSKEPSHRDDAQSAIISNLPFQKALPPHESAANNALPIRKRRSSTLLGQANRDTHAIHILIVEDNLVNQKVLAKQLRHIGMNVDVANHGGEALDYLRSTRFYPANGKKGKELSLILMDWEMPVMDGLTCVRNIRQLQKDGTVRGHVPVIAITANVRAEQIKVAMEAGMDDVVSKPFRVHELRARIEKLLSS